MNLKNGVVLAELGGYGDGPYCAKHGNGATLVMMGTYIIDPGDNVPYPEPFVFKPDQSIYVPYLEEHIAAARKSNAQVGVSAISIEISHTLDFLSAAEKAGADYASLCAHSHMDMFVSKNLGEEICRIKNESLLRTWATAILDTVSIPVIFKISLLDFADTVNAVEVMTELGIQVVHINIKKAQDKSGKEPLQVLEQLKGKSDCLIAGGGIENIDDAQRMLNAGADAVAIGTAAMKDPDLCESVQKLLDYSP